MWVHTKYQVNKVKNTVYKYSFGNPIWPKTGKPWSNFMSDSNFFILYLDSLDMSSLRGRSNKTLRFVCCSYLQSHSQGAQAAGPSQQECPSLDKFWWNGSAGAPLSSVQECRNWCYLQISATDKKRTAETTCKMLYTNVSTLYGILIPELQNITVHVWVVSAGLGGK